MSVSTAAWVKAFGNVSAKVEGSYNRDVGSYHKEYAYNAVSATYRIPHGQTVWWQGGAKYTAPFFPRVTFMTFTPSVIAIAARAIGSGAIIDISSSLT